MIISSAAKVGILKTISSIITQFHLILTIVIATMIQHTEKVSYLVQGDGVSLRSWRGGIVIGYTYLDHTSKRLDASLSEEKYSPSG